MSKTLVANSNLAVAPANTIKGNSTGSSGQPTDISIDNTLTFADNKFGVKLASGGGLVVDSSGLKIATSTSVAIAVRPGDTSSPAGNATDDCSIKRVYVNSGNDQAVLQPYFNTFTAAQDYANANFTGTYYIYIDGNTSENVSVNASAGRTGITSNTISRYLTQSEVNSLIGSTTSGLSAGNYVWNAYYNVTTPTPAAFVGDAGWSTNAQVRGVGVYAARYYRSSTNSWTTNRKFNEPPVKLSWRFYFDSSGSLAPGVLGSTPSNWTKYCPANYPTTRTGLVSVRPIIFQNTIQSICQNLCFEIFHNTASSTPGLWANGNTVLQILNCTSSLQGTGLYDYGFCFGTTGSTIYCNGGLLQDPTTSDASPLISYPGYGLACVGSSSAPTNVSCMVTLDQSFFDNWSYNLYIYNPIFSSGLTASIILANKINMPNGLFVLHNSSRVNTPNLILTNNFSLSSYGYDYSTTNLRTSTQYNTISFSLDQLSKVVFNSDVVLNWTYHQLARGTNTAYTSAYPLTLWHTLPAGGTTLPGATINTTTNLLTFNSNITNSSSLYFATFNAPTHAPKSTISAVRSTYTELGSNTSGYSSTSFIPMTNLYTIVAADSNAYTLSYYA